MTPTDPPPTLESELRASLARQAATVDPTPDETALQDLRDRVAGIREVPAASPPRRRPVVLRAAAVVVVLVAIGGLLVIRSRDDGESTVQSTPTEGTGFYVPHDLPAGWEVVQVRVQGSGPNGLADPHPSERRVYSDDDDHDRYLLLKVRAANPTNDNAVPTVGDPVELGSDVTGRWTRRLSDDGPADTFEWVRGGRLSRLRWSGGIDHAVVVAAARDLVADDTSTPSGWHERSRASAPSGRSPSVELLVRTAPDGTGLTVRLASPAVGTQTDTIDLANLTLLDLPTGPALRTPAEAGGEGYVEGLFDDATVTAGQGDLPYQGSPNARRDAGLEAYETMLRHLRPATASEWADFIRSVPTFDPGVIADRLGAVRPSVPRGIVATTDPATVTVESGRMQELTLRLRNTTSEVIDVGQLCSGRWGLAPEGRPDPEHMVSLMVDCGPTRVPASGQVERTYGVRATDDGSANGHRLPAGRYHFVIEDSTGDHRLADVPVTVIPRVERDEDGEWQTSRPHVNEGKNAGDISELRFTLSVDRTSVAAGRTLGATLTVDNPTDHDIDWATCMERTLKRGLVPADDATPALPPQLVIDCEGTPVRAIGPGESHTFPLEGAGQALAARSPVANGMGQGLAGALAPGRYRAAVEVFGRTSIAVVRSRQVVTVGPPPCPGFTDELVQRFRGFPSVSEASRRAAEIDMTVRVVQEDYKAIPHRDDLDCSRIDVVVLDDQVHDVVGVY